jgi:hypothetical protein
MGLKPGMQRNNARAKDEHTCCQAVEFLVLERKHEHHEDLWAIFVRVY